MGGSEGGVVGELGDGGRVLGAGEGEGEGVVEGFLVPGGGFGEGGGDLAHRVDGVEPAQPRAAVGFELREELLEEVVA